MSATWKEQEFAKSNGVNIKYWLSPKSLIRKMVMYPELNLNALN
ncbi:MAG: hypothetical protein CM1200mP30_21090 [Pseudomonadota bacterium]|nr:MAG: hypothetical protein CM1200mP30_21090 [Pseudomonadota bacterium]